MTAKLIQFPGLQILRREHDAIDHIARIIIDALGRRHVVVCKKREIAE